MNTAASSAALLIVLTLLAPAVSTQEASQGFLYGRVVTDDGATYEGRLRFGGDEEAFWGDYFNGVKRANPWAAHTQKRPIEIFGFQIPPWGPRTDLTRPLMTRFGDIAR